MTKREDDYIITITNEFVKVEHPECETELIRFADIDKILLINTDEGPFLPDIWLSLCGKNGKCVLPYGTKGFDEVYDIVSKYENFNFENFIASMSCSCSQIFILWERDKTT